MKGNKGFTLIELLIVVAIIAILAAIAIPNFLQAQVRSKVSRAKSEEQSLATAIESYYIDNNVYPRADEASDVGNSQTWYSQGTWATEGGVIPRALTTPVSYISSLFKEPFRKNGTGFYGYGGGPVNTDYSNTWPASGWIADSFGPDNAWGYAGNGLQEDSAWTDTVEPFVTTPLQQSPYTYDPTNGTTSGGDVWRRGP